MTHKCLKIYMFFFSRIFLRFERLEERDWTFRQQKLFDQKTVSLESERRQFKLLLIKEKDIVVRVLWLNLRETFKLKGNAHPRYKNSTVLVFLQSKELQDFGIRLCIATQVKCNIAFNFALYANILPLKIYRQIQTALCYVKGVAK